MDYQNDQFDKILNWDLKVGSHEFPGPSGGTCINEAAIVAMGFDYKAISRASDCPPCFSRVFAAYAIAVNDRMPDRLRNKLLMPFVMRLGGTADTPEIEQQRLDALYVGNVSRVLPIFLRQAGLEDEAARCETVTTRPQARSMALDARQAARAKRQALCRPTLGGCPLA